jgi:hypothetical protein
MRSFAGSKRVLVARLTLTLKTEKKNDTENNEKNGNMNNIYYDVHLDLMNPSMKHFRKEN